GGEHREVEQNRCTRCADRVGNGLSPIFSRAAQLPEWPKMFSPLLRPARCYPAREEAVFREDAASDARESIAARLLSHRGRLQSCSEPDRKSVVYGKRIGMASVGLYGA